LAGEPYPGFQAHGQAIRYVDGHWRHPELIDPSDGLVDVSCPISSYCAAVDSGGRLITFAHGSWSAPSQTADRSLVSIDCAAPEHCVTWGRGGTLILAGQSWHHVVTPGRHGYLTGIDCVDTAFCVAESDLGVQELHAGVWAQLPGDSASRPIGASCASRTLCVADAHDVTSGPVGETFNGSADRQSKFHHERAVSCAAGPMCIEVTENSAWIGTSL
jgi:hypothetical protein